MNRFRTSEEVIAYLVKSRKEQNISQRTLADMTGLKQSTIARIESNRVNPNMTSILKICEALKLDINLVFRE